MLTQEKLKKRRLTCKDIPTDSEGNLVLDDSRRISGTRQRQKCCNGHFYQKPHPERPNEVQGTYVQYDFGDPLPLEKQTDVPV